MTKTKAREKEINDHLNSALHINITPYLTVLHYMLQFKCIFENLPAQMLKGNIIVDLPVKCSNFFLKSFSTFPNRESYTKSFNWN